MDSTQQTQLLQVLRQRSHAIAESWYQAIAHTGFVPLGEAQVRQHITELTEQAISFLSDEALDCERARSIGASLARLGYVRPEAMAETQEVLTHQLVQDLPAEMAVALQPRLAALLGRMASGLFQTVLSIALDEQEQIRSALIAGRQRIEKALRESEARYRSLVETSPDAILLTDLDGIILFCNQRAAALLGYAGVEELIWKNTFVLVAPQDRQRVIDNVRQMLETGSGRNVEYTLFRKDGSSFPADISGALLTDADGQPKAFIAVVRDITERKHNEQSEREQRALAEALRDTSAALNSTLEYEKVLDYILANLGRVVLHDSANFMLVDEQRGDAFVVRHQGYAERGLNEWMRALRFSIADTPGLRQMADTHQPLIVPDTQTWPSWIHFAETEWIRSYAAVPIRTKGRLVGFLNLDSVTPNFFTFAHAERLQAFADQAAVAIENSRLYETTRRNVEWLTRLHEAGAALAVAESVDVLYQEIVRRAVQLVNANTSTLALFDGAEYLVAVAAENLPDHVVGSRVRLGEGLNGRAAQLRQPQRTRNYFQLDSLQRSTVAEGLPYVAVVALPLVWQERLVGTLAVTDDREREFDDHEMRILTSLATLAAAALEQRRAEAEMRAGETEARTLTTRLAHAQEQERARIAMQLHGSVSSHLVTLEKNTEYLQAQVPHDDPLHERLEVNTALLQVTHQAIRSLAMDLDIRQLADLGLDPVARRYVERLRTADCPVGLRVTGCARRLPVEVEQLAFRTLQEVLTNSVRHAEAIRISAHLHFGREFLRLTVQDNGRGFDVVGLADGVTMGLADLRRRAQALDGKLGVESTPGRGTRVMLYLPFKVPASAQLQIPVMLVESHDVIRHGLRLALTESGEFTCVGEASEGLAALHQIELSQPELVLMDVRLPGLSGIEITRQIARRFPQVHVVLLSYTADETYLEQALQVGAKGFLLVSDESRQIRDALRAVLRGEIAVTPVLSDIWARLRARSAAGAPLEPITLREREVLTLIAAGYSSQMIADQMGISRRTVEVHRRNLKAKLQTKNSAQLIQAAIRLGLVSFKP